MKTAIDNYFNSSYKNMVSFFAKEEKISAIELREILAMIESTTEKKIIIYGSTFYLYRKIIRLSYTVLLCLPFFVT